MEEHILFGTCKSACCFGVALPTLNHPREDAGDFKSRIRPPYPQRVVKGD